MKNISQLKWTGPRVYASQWTSIQLDSLSEAVELHTAFPISPTNTFLGTYHHHQQKLHDKVRTGKTITFISFLITPVHHLHPVFHMP